MLSLKIRPRSTTVLPRVSIPGGHPKFILAHRGSLPNKLTKFWEAERIGGAMLWHLAVVLALLASISAGNAKRSETKALALPQWVEPRNGTLFRNEYRRNLAAIAKIDAKGEQMDVAIYGDSIIAWNKPFNLPKNPGTRKYWNLWFGDLNAEPLGISGDRIANLMWRLAVGNERPKYANPKVVVIFIGTNDAAFDVPYIPEKIDYLLRWLHIKMSDSKIVLQSLLPTFNTSAVTNQVYQRSANKYGVTYSTCMQDIATNERAFMVDVLHPNTIGQDKLLKCLRNLVQPFLETAPVIINTGETPISMVPVPP